MPPTASHHRARALGYTAVAVGLAAIAMGLAWRQVAPRELFWTADDAQEYAEAASAAHEASVGPPHAHSDGQRGDHDPAPRNDDELAAAKARFQAGKERLATARAARDYTGHALAVAGAALAAAGVAALRRASPKGA